MPKDDRNQAYHRLLDEVNQAHAVRRSLYADLETELGENKRVVALCTSFRWPVLIEDRDADMLEEALRNSDMHGRELVLIVNSAGGLALPAERIVNICRTYSKGGKYAVIVPKMAKSAATMVCLGADRIGMSRTSELGPIDPQISIIDESGGRYLAAHEIVESYEELMRKANRTSGRIEPYLQQLQRFDARDVRAVRSARELSENIAVRCLQRGMLRGRSSREIRKKIKPFLDPRQTIDHGRAIYHDVAAGCGLRVELHEAESSVWSVVWQLYQKLNYVLTAMPVGKVIESFGESWVASVEAPRSV